MIRRSYTTTSNICIVSAGALRPSLALRPWPVFLYLLNLLLFATPALADQSDWSVVLSPLDTLVTGTSAPTAAGHAGMTRNTLPDVTTTSLPRRPPPAAPPRLDDPAAGNRLFRVAAHASRHGFKEQAETAIRSAQASRPGDSRLALWQVTETLRNPDPGAFVWHLPGALRAVHRDPLAIPRLAVQGHQAALLLLAVFWTLLVVACLAGWWRPLSHDLSALLFRDPQHRIRMWTPCLLICVVILVRPGWLGALALLSLPLLLQIRGKARGLMLVTWLAGLALSFPNWPLLRDSMPYLDPGSETALLARAGCEDASPQIIQELRERAGQKTSMERQQRLQLALGLQEARRGRFSASSEHFHAVLEQRPDDIVAMVGSANNAYYLSRFDESLIGYRAARQLAPHLGEIPFNMAQAYLKKLFLPEAGQALEEARSLGFASPDPVSGQHKEQDFAPTVYLGLSRRDLQASAAFERNMYPPLASLAAWNHFLGAPPLPLFVMLAGILITALLLVYWGRLQDNVRHCDSCGSEICQHCCHLFDGGTICHTCAETIERSRSEMVLATLLKNRSRAMGLATTTRLVQLARALPGAAHLSIGDVACALRRLGLLAVALFLIVFGWSFDLATTWHSPGLILTEETLHPLWMPFPAKAWPGPLGWPVSAGWILLGSAYLLALIDASRLRQQLPERMIQLHGQPSLGPGRT